MEINPYGLNNPVPAQYGVAGSAATPTPQQLIDRIHTIQNGPGTDEEKLAQLNQVQQEIAQLPANLQEAVKSELKPVLNKVTFACWKALDGELRSIQDSTLLSPTQKILALLL